MIDPINDIGIIGRGSLTPKIRERIVKAYRKGYHVKDIADMFDFHRWTVWH